MRSFLFLLVLASALLTRAAEFDPLRYFARPHHSTGSFQLLLGKKHSFSNDSTGRWEGGGVILRQHFHFEQGREEERVWRLRRTGPHQYAGWASDGVGIAHGEVHGNSFHWDYVVAVDPGHQRGQLHFDQWMTLQPDGTLLNGGAIRKAGVKIGQLEERFPK